MSALKKFGLMLVAFVILSVAVPVLAIGETSFREAECPFDVSSPDREGKTIICGFLRVPESRTGLSDAIIELAVVILKSTSDNPAEPIVYFEGGPGGGAISAIGYWAESTPREYSDIVLFDQRGTGYSTPTLNCIEYNNFEDLPSYADIDEICHDRLVDEGIALGAYNTAESSADFSDLISALGYDRVNIYGISYGSRLALGVMRDYPKRIRSAVLEGVYPPNVQRWEELPLNGVRAFNVMFDDCEANERCNEAYPQLRRTFFKMIEELNFDPMIATFDDFDFPIFGDDVVDQVFDLLYVTELIPYIPAIIVAAAERDFDTYFDLSQFDRRSSDSDADDFSEGMFLSVECYDEVPFNNQNTAEDLVERINPSLANALLNGVTSMFYSCNLWDIDASSGLENEPVQSDIPTLVLNGEYDPITPPNWGKAAADYLPNSFMYTFPGMGHGVVDLDPCPTEIFMEFLKNPTEEPDASCIDKMNPPVFYLGD